MTSHDKGPGGPIAVNFHLYKPCNCHCRFCFATFRELRGQLDLEQARALLRALRARLVARGGKYSW